MVPVAAFETLYTRLGYGGRWDNLSRSTRSALNAQSKVGDRNGSPQSGEIHAKKEERVPSAVRSFRIEASQSHASRDRAASEQNGRTTKPSSVHLRCPRSAQHSVIGAGAYLVPNGDGGRSVIAIMSANAAAVRYDDNHRRFCRGNFGNSSSPRLGQLVARCLCVKGPIEASLRPI